MFSTNHFIHNIPLSFTTLLNQSNLSKSSSLSFLFLLDIHRLTIFINGFILQLGLVLHIDAILYMRSSTFMFG